MKKKHILHISIYSVLAAVISVGVFMSITTYALWTGTCAWSGGEGSDLTVTAGNTCILTGNGGATSITVDAGGTLDIGDGIGTGGSLTVTGGDVVVDGDLVVDNLSSLTISTANNLTVQNTGTVTNGGTVNVNQNTNIYHDLTTFTNNGTLITYKLFIGDAGTEGGQLINAGTVNVTFSTANAEDSIYIREGQFFNNNTSLISPSLTYRARMWLQGTAVETSLFENHGLVDAGENWLFVNNYSLVDLQAGRFVMNKSGCNADFGFGGSVRLESALGTPADAKINIEAPAVLSADFIEVGWGPTPSSGQIINNGTIDKVDLAGNSLNCRVEFRLYENSVIDNKTLGLIDLGENGNIEMYANSVFNNEPGAFITGQEPSNISISDIGTIFNQGGSIQGVRSISMGSNTVEGGTFNAGTESITHVRTFSIGNQSGNMGGTVNLSLGGEIILDNSIIVEGNGVLHADGHIEGVSFAVMSGDASAPFAELKDTAEAYDFNVMYIETPEAGFTAQLDVNSLVVLNLNGSILYPGDGLYYSGIIGFDNELNNDGEILFNLDGTLNVVNDPVNQVKFLINNFDALLTIGPDGFLNIDETDGQFVVNAPFPYGLIDLSNDPLTEGVDVETDVIIGGYYKTDNRLDAVDLTVKSGGHMTSGDNPLQIDTNFIINARDVVVEAGGQIASDGVSSRGAILNGPGSYGGEGMDRGSNTSYGQVKMDETFTPLYGEAGRTAGVSLVPGGGGVRIHSTGSITIDGLVSASGYNATAPGEYGGAGGTVIIVHEPTDPGAFFKGTGNIYANGNGDPTHVLGGAIGAGGGRISIISPLLDYPDFGSNDFTGFIDAGGGENSAGEAGSAGTIYFGGDRHSPNGTLIVNQLGQTLTGEETRIPDNNEIFDRIEVLGGGDMTWEDDPGLPFDPPTSPAVCYETNGTITFVTLTCADYQFGDKPDTLYMAATNAQAINPEQEPGYQAADGVENVNLVIAAENPVLSVIYRNPVNPLTIDRIQVQIDNDADFSSPIWDYEKVNLKKADGTALLPNQRTQDIRYNENGTALSALIPGTTYYIRVRFITNPPGLWSHGDYNDQYRFTTNPPPPAVTPTSGPAGGRRPGSNLPGTVPEEEQPQEEPEEPAEPVEQEPAVEPEPEPEPEQPSPEEPAPEPQPQPIIPQKPIMVIDYSAVEEAIEEPTTRPSAPEEAEPVSTDGPIKGCTRADITDRILNEFNLYELLKERDEQCRADWQHCMLPFIIHSNHEVTEESYYSDVFLADEMVSDSNPFPPAIVADEMVSDSNPFPPALGAAIEFGTRNGIVQGYYEEPESPFRPYENMNRIEILKLLNWVTGQKWIYYEEFISQIGGEQNLSLLKRYAPDINEWWHIRYHNYACENGLLECDSKVDFKPYETCSVDWIDGMISKYKQYYETNNLAERFIKDTDNDLILDDDENNIYLTDFKSEDTDNDNLNDGVEINVHKTNPLMIDTDYDTLDDGDEIQVYKTNPLNPDTDSDGVPDGVEISYGTDANNPNSKPEDLNVNGIADAWETQFKINPPDGSSDMDGDGLSDLLEYRSGTNPLNSDTDGDGLTDSEEVLLYLTDPLKSTDLTKFGVKITNIKDGMIITDRFPTIQGFAPKSGMEILLIIKNEFGQEILLGKTISDNNKIFIFKSEFELHDGQFYLMAKAMDPENKTVLNSQFVFVKLDSTLDLDHPKLERISEKTITDKILLDALTVEVDDNTPVLYGRTGQNNKVIATWQSVIGVSSVVADIAGNEFRIPSPQEMPLGGHQVTVYAVRETDQAMSRDVTINFNIVEPETIVQTHETAAPNGREGLPWWIWPFLGVIVVGASGAAYLLKKKK